MQSYSKKKLLSGILVPTITLSIAATTTALVFSFHKTDTKTDKKDYTITFNAGEGKFTSGQNNKADVYAGTRFDHIDQPIVECENKEFTGWYDQNRNLILPGQSINTNLTLTAGYSNATTGSFIRLRFVTGSSGATIQGNTSISVNSGYHFFMVNRPNVKKEGSWLKNWVYQNGSKAGQDVLENDLMTENVTLVPKMASAVSVTWYGNGATKIRGADKTYAVTETKFKNINQPAYEFGTSMFQGWYKDQDCTEPWDGDEQVTEDSVAYAKWEQSPSQYYCVVNYKQKPDTTIVPIFSPSTSQIILKTTTWENVFKPTVTTALGDYVVDYWEYSLDGTTNWTTITSSTTFNLDSVYIAPHLTPDAYLYLDGSSSLYTSSNSAAYQALIYPASIGVTSTEWSVSSWSGDEQYKPDISTDGIVTTKGGTGVLTIKALVTLTGGKQLAQTKSITVSDPTVASSEYWMLDSTGWVKLDAYKLYNPDASEITGVKADGTAYTCSRESFNGQITIGANVTQILDDFLVNCPALTTAPTFAGSAITKIGDGFMYGCSGLNSAVTIPNSVTSIGSEFLANCTSFNSTLTLSNTLESIGSQFLMNCTSFNQDLTIPSTITSVGAHFMVNNDAFTNTLTIGCESTAFDQGDIYSFSTSNSTAAHYITGAIVTGTGADGFKNLYKAADGEYLGESDIYRKYVTA